MSNVDDLIYSPIEDDDPETHEDVGYDERFVHVDWLGGIEIFCPRHGPFRIAPQNCFKGHGCPYCARQHSKRGG